MERERRPGLFWGMLALTIAGGLAATVGFWMVSPVFGIVTLVVVSVGITLGVMSS